MTKGAFLLGYNHSWQRVPNTPYLMKIPYITYTPLFLILTNPLPNLHPTALFVNLFLSIVDRATFDVLFYSKILGSTHVKPWYNSTRKILLCVLCNKVSSLSRSDIFGFYTSTLIWYFTHIQRHTAHSGLIDWHTHLNINTTCYVPIPVYITLNE